MLTQHSISKSSLVLTLAILSLLFCACRKSTFTTESAPDYKIDRVIGTYLATDTMFKNNGYPFNVFDTSYQTLILNVSAKGSCMIKFDSILADDVVYDSQFYNWDTVSTSYEYYTRNTPPSYGYLRDYRVVVRFKGDTMFYNTSNSEERTIHKGMAIKR